MRPETLKKRIRMELAKRYIKQTTLAEALGYSRANFNHALKPNARTTPTYLEMLHRAWWLLNKNR